MEMTEKQLEFNFRCILKSIGDFENEELNRLSKTFTNYAIKFKNDGNLL